MKKHLRNIHRYVDISNFERRGVFTLLLCVILVMGFKVYENTRTHEIPTLSQEQINAVKAMLDSCYSETRPNNNAYIKKTYTKKWDKPKRKWQKANPLARFNPNKDSYHELTEKGLSHSVAKNITAFRSKGGSFKTPLDLQKLYAIDDQIFNQIQDYINIEKTSLNFKKPSSVKSKPIVTIEINSATLEEWISLPGIGPAFAGRIIKYKEMLGGFYDITQLEKVYGIPPETIEAIQSHLTLDVSKITKLNLNTAEIKDVAKFKSISYQMAKAIINYRDVHDGFKSVEEFTELHILKGVNLVEILPYIDVN